MPTRQPGVLSGHETKAKGELFAYLLYGGFGRVECEAMVWPGRRFRADYYLPDQSPPVVVEYDGMMRGDAHASISGSLRDSEKGNLAQFHGMRFYRFNAKSIDDGSAFAFLEAALAKIEEVPA